MPFNDLREYINCLEKEGEVQRITQEVQPVFEVGAIIRRSYDLRAPAPFFLNLRGYLENRIFGAPIGLSRRKDRLFARFAISMDMPPQSTALEIIEEYISRLKKPVKPVLVKSGPCKENVLKGDAVDLHGFPAPVLHQGDGGPYLGTWHANITKDPDTGVQNWGLYRLMIHDKKTMGGLFLPAQNIGLHYYTKYEARGKPMEFAIAVGTEPVTPWVAGTRFPPNVSEADIIGGIRRLPLELVRCETVNLAVPATSEIVIEGFIPPHERKEEGPFGEYTGFMASDRALRPVYHVTAITHRNNPILPVTCHPKRGIVQVENVPGHPLLPFLSPEEKTQHLGAYALFDCTWPREWSKDAIPVKASFDNIWPKEVQEKVLRNWRAYGYKEEGLG